MTCRSNAGSAVDVEADVPLATPLWRAGMEPHACRDGQALWPQMDGKRSLDFYGCQDGIGFVLAKGKNAHVAVAESLADGTVAVQPSSQFRLRKTGFAFN